MVGEFDILIAAIIISNQKELLARDEHFELPIFTSKLLKGQKKRSASEAHAEDVNAYACVVLNWYTPGETLLSCLGEVEAFFEGLLRRL